MFEQYLKTYDDSLKHNEKINIYNKNSTLKIKQENTKPLVLFIFGLFIANMFLYDFLFFIAENWNVFEGSSKRTLGEQNLSSIIDSFKYKNSWYHYFAVLIPFSILSYYHTRLLYFCYDNTHRNKEKWFKLSQKSANVDGCNIIPFMLSGLLTFFLFLTDFHLANFYHLLNFFTEFVLFLYVVFYIFKKNESNISQEHRDFLTNKSNEIIQELKSLKNNILNDENEMRKIAEIKCFHSDKNDSEYKNASFLLGEFQKLHKNRRELSRLNNDINDVFGLENNVKNKIIND